jgi:hypothetical protein
MNQSSGPISKTKPGTSYAPVHRGKQQETLTEALLSVAFGTTALDHPSHHERLERTETPLLADKQPSTVIKQETNRRGWRITLDGGAGNGEARQA